MNQDNHPLSVILKTNNQLVNIPAGKIELRDDRTKKKWQIEIKSFWLAKFPVTQDIYQEIMHESPSYFRGNKKPVESISWKEAAMFCNSLSHLANLDSCYIFHTSNEEISFDLTKNGFRLPTEAEWQYACQAGTKKIRYGELDEIAWYKENSNQETHEVGKKFPNEWGLYDMLGNVWEWCSDIYDEKIYGSYRIFRGGGYFDEERSVMATTRRRSHPIGFKIDDLGFRIAKNIS